MKSLDGLRDTMSPLYPTAVALAWSDIRQRPSRSGRRCGRNSLNSYITTISAGAKGPRGYLGGPESPRVRESGSAAAGRWSAPSRTTAHGCSCRSCAYVEKALGRNAVILSGHHHLPLPLRLRPAGIPHLAARKRNLQAELGGSGIPGPGSAARTVAWDCRRAARGSLPLEGDSFAATRLRSRRSRAIDQLAATASGRPSRRFVIASPAPAPTRMDSHLQGRRTGPRHVGAYAWHPRSMGSTRAVVQNLVRADGFTDRRHICVHLRQCSSFPVFATYSPGDPDLHACANHKDVLDVIHRLVTTELRRYGAGRQDRIVPV